MSYRPLLALTTTLTWIALAAPGHARSLVDERLARAKPGRCAFAGNGCMAFGKVAILGDDCKPLQHSNGLPQCGTYTGYWCAAGFQQLYLSPFKAPYYRASDGGPLDEKLTYFTVSTPVDCRPPRQESCFAGLDAAARTHLVKGWYCKMLNLVQGFFSDTEDLIRRLRDNAGLIARFNSAFGGAPSLSSLEDKFAEHRKTLSAELRQFHLDESAGRRIGSGYYENRLRVLRELQDLHDELFGRVRTAQRAIVRTAERGEVIAKKVQKVLIKVAGYAVFAFTGGNRIAQCLTEAGIETAADAVTQKLKGNELTLSGFGKDALRTLIFRCADALTGGPGGDVLGMLTGGFTGFFKDLEKKIQEYVKTRTAGFWRKMASKVKWVVDKLSFLMDDAVVRVFSTTAEEVVVEFGGEVFPACVKPLLKRDWQGLFRCLGSAARKALGVGVPKGLFEAALKLLEENVPRARGKLEELARFAGLADHPTVKTLLTGLTVVSKAGVAQARSCKDEIRGFSSLLPVFGCVARALGKIKVETLAPLAVWEILQQALSASEDAIVDRLRERQREIAAGLEAMGAPLPATVLSLLRAAARDVARTFARSARGCLPKAGEAGTLKQGVRATVTCLGQAARKAFGATGHALVHASLQELAQAAEKGAAALSAAIGEALERARMAVDDIVLVPAPVQEAVRRAKKSSGKNLKAFARELATKCARRAGKSESLRDYVRASARCLADAATTQLRAPGAGAFLKLLAELRRWVSGLPKEKKDAAAALVQRLGAVADTLGLELAPVRAADVKVELGRDAGRLARRVGSCVAALTQAANAAAKSHERLSSIARELRRPMQVFGRCVQGTVAQRSKAGAPAKKPAKKAPPARSGKKEAA